MQAMIFAAGLGTRLAPLTNTTPKAMVKIGEHPLLWHAIQKLKTFGYERIIINTHHFAEQIKAYLKANKNFGLDIVISDESHKLLETGGGLLMARAHFIPQQPLLVCNVDIIHEINLFHLLQQHSSTGAYATLAVSKRKTSRYLLFDKNDRLKGWQNKKTGQTKPADLSIEGLQALAFSGIQIIQPVFIDYIERRGKFSIIDAYLDAMQEFNIHAYRHDGDYWLDVGKMKQLEEARERLEGIN